MSLHMVCHSTCLATAPGLVSHLGLQDHSSHIITCRYGAALLAEWLAPHRHAALLVNLGLDADEAGAARHDSISSTEACRACLL
jgi:hypothetical protein